MNPQITYLLMDYNPLDNPDARGWTNSALWSMSEYLDPSIAKEVIILSQGNSDTHNQQLYANCRYLGYTFIALPQNVGISAGINIGLKLARSPYFGVISSDVQVTRGMDRALIDCLNANERNKVAIPRSQKSEVEYQQYIPREQYGSPDVDLTDAPGDVSCIAYELSVLFMKTDLRHTIGYFDEQWKACYENLDYGIRTVLTGGRNIICKNAFAWHVHGGCIKSNARHKTYDGYIEMPHGFDQNKVAILWRQKWGNIMEHIDFYKPLDPNKILSGFTEKYGPNLYIKADQDRGY